MITLIIMTIIYLIGCVTNYTTYFKIISLKHYVKVIELNKSRAIYGYISLSLKEVVKDTDYGVPLKTVILSWYKTRELYRDMNILNEEILKL